MTRRNSTLVPFSIYSIFFVLFLFSHAKSQLNDQEQAVLLNLKQQWQNPQPLSHWTPSNSSHCSWPEITCTDGSVSGISLWNMSINGTIPSFICDLKNLTVIDFSWNYFTSQEFPEVFNCSKLEVLNLYQNNLAGTVPDDINRMARLRQLNLAANFFSGNVPGSIGQLTELRQLQLSSCQFEGSFPAEIGNLSNLEVLKLSCNRRITPARLPSNYTKLKKLKYLWMFGSNLIGDIPDAIGEMAALEYLDLSSNNLRGKIPSSLFVMKNLRVVYLYKNKLSGEIPRIIEAINITVIDLSNNSLTGTIPEDFGKLNLSELSLFFNQLSGEIPVSIGRLPGLKILKLFNNNFSGTLPPDFGRYSMLEEFQVSSNRLTGTLPEHLCDNGRLVGVIAFDNDLHGELPMSLGNCSGLSIVRVHNNSLSGNVPSSLWTSLNLITLMLSDNLFIGELPKRLSQNLSRLEISNNKFSGKIPLGVSSWRNMVVFQASNNLLNGPIPPELTALPHLTTLMLDHNLLSGSLPSDIISWKLLNILNLRGNAISGQIPEEFGTLPVLNSLDLSENQLSGQIPPQFGLLKLTSLNLSSNLLTGRIPSEFENNVYPSSFLNNPGLCAISTSLNINSCNSKLLNSSKISSQLVAWVISLVAATLLAVLISFLLIKIYRKRKRDSDSTWKLTSFQKLNFTESDILPGLTESNMIGSGGSGKVYHVAVSGSSDTVAVKKIWNTRKLEQKLENQFLSEVKILSSIRHSNVVKLLCCISNDNSKLLVYEYLVNCSLDQWLHKKSRGSTVSSSVPHVVLDWPKRLHIAIGAAQGLSYLHHDCSPPIVHRDVKSSNILLDPEFNAKVADFGLAKMLIKEGESVTMSVVAGSFGYIAPEYALTTRVNEKIDVYSFGVILLELATGRKAKDGDEHTSLAEWAWRHYQDGNPIVDALDEEVKEQCYLDQMYSVFTLGIICTGTQPSARPSMKEVLRILVQCNQPLGYAKKNAANDCIISPPPREFTGKLENTFG